MNEEPPILQGILAVEKWLKDNPNADSIHLGMNVFVGLLRSFQQHHDTLMDLTSLLPKDRDAEHFRVRQALDYADILGTHLWFEWEDPWMYEPAPDNPSVKPKEDVDAEE